jgi:hypothetical protein
MSEQKKQEQKKPVAGRVLARVLAEDVLEHVTGGLAQSYVTCVVTLTGSDITNLDGDNDGTA